MPTYDYECPSCEKIFEEFQSITAPKLTDCKLCGAGGVKRLISAGSGVVLKGSGWYETDFKSKPKSNKKESTTKNSTTAKKENKTSKTSKKD